MPRLAQQMVEPTASSPHTCHASLSSDEQRGLLLLPYKHVDGATMHGPVVTNLVLKEATVWLFDILRQVGIEHKRGDLCVRNLRAILDLDILALG